VIREDCRRCWFSFYLSFFSADPVCSLRFFQVNVVLLRDIFLVTVEAPLGRTELDLNESDNAKSTSRIREEKKKSS
jgi:hypothetical protein